MQSSRNVDVVLTAPAWAILACVLSAGKEPTVMHPTLAARASMEDVSMRSVRVTLAGRAALVLCAVG